MSITLILICLLFVIYSITLPKIFDRAGEDSWKGYIPIVNLFFWIKLLKRPWWWFILLIIPGVNFIMFTILNVETAIAFDKRLAIEQWFAGALPWVFFPKLAFVDKDAKWVGPRNWDNVKKSIFREWGEAIIFAVVAASIIRSFFLEAFTIPTPSMEGSMLVGDYLFVSKMSYGARVPETPLSIPFVHNVIPGSMTNSYLEWIKFDYMRLPGFGDVERNDALVFNFPPGDTVLNHPFFVSHDYYSFLRKEAIGIAGNYEKYKGNPEKYKDMAYSNFVDKNYCASCGGVRIGGVKVRPVDKKDNYVKRCVGMPGEDLEIKSRQVYINGKALDNPDKLQFYYVLGFKEGAKNKAVNKITKEFNLLLDEEEGLRKSNVVVLTNAEYEEVLSWDFTIKEKCHPLEDVKDVENNQESIFPNSSQDEFLGWTKDNYGPIHIPAKGESIELNERNFALFKRVIRAYEHNTLEYTNGMYILNGVEATSYTFKQNYYWAMGDNRHNSADSRFWGYVPEDHVVGKALFTWFSKEDMGNHGRSGIRWKRMFKTVERPE